MEGIEGQGLERVFRQLGVDTTYIDGVEAPQEFRFNFSAGWYTKTAVKRAMDLLKCRYGYTYELNANYKEIKLWERTTKK